MGVYGREQATLEISVKAGNLSFTIHTSVRHSSVFEVEPGFMEIMKRKFSENRNHVQK